ncbi:hypothetical protein [Pseudoalteromonas umbrosa]|uniref:hypothetical protein n=1 Tax=Pseudoalteromonas umbrosa TaxID=3048489 RepID=UPI0024C2FB74|nr:hypothetical protein [Pseudoalteromonas sp. B95]MDK1290188.1 hypothetical protein [Pseudoalteromonas sp. B95]
MALSFAVDSTLARYVKSLAQRATTEHSTLTPAERSVLLMSALAAASNIEHEALRLTTIKWVNARATRIDFNPRKSAAKGPE